MFYEPTKRNHGLPHDPFKAIVAPRPIGWISTVSADGKVNLAPYSFFNALGAHPHLVMFAPDGEKDSLVYARETGEFVASLVTQDLVEKMNLTSVDAPRGTSEFEYAGLTPAPSNLVAPPRVAEAGAALECKVTDIIKPKAADGTPSNVFIVLGEVIGIHLDEKLIKDGLFDITAARTVSRLGYLDYAAVTETFALNRPKWEG